MALFSTRKLSDRVRKQKTCIKAPVAASFYLSLYFFYSHTECQWFKYDTKTKRKFKFWQDSRVKERSGRDVRMDIVEWSDGCLGENEFMLGFMLPFTEAMLLFWVTLLLLDPSSHLCDAYGFTMTYNQPWILYNSMTKSSRRSAAINRSYSGYSSRNLVMVCRMYDENQSDLVREPEVRSANVEPQKQRTQEPAAILNLDV